MTTEMYDESIVETDTESTTTATNMKSTLKFAIRYIIIYVLSILAISYGYLVLYMSAQFLLIPFYFFCKTIRHPLSEENALVACNILVVVQVGFFFTLWRRRLLNIDTRAVVAASVCAFICLLALAGVVGQILAVLAG